MSKFAHEKDSTVYDPQPATDLSAYLLRYNAVAVYSWMLAGHAFKEVPEYVQHGAHDNGDGTYTNPPPPPSEQ